jgi:hypothetical protein
MRNFIALIYMDVSCFAIGFPFRQIGFPRYETRISFPAPGIGSFFFGLRAQTARHHGALLCGGEQAGRAIVFRSDHAEESSPAGLRRKDSGDHGKGVSRDFSLSSAGWDVGMCL